MKNGLLSIHDLTRYQFNLILETARRMKRQPQRYRARLSGRTLAVISTAKDYRPPACFQTAISQLGGTPIPVPAGTPEPPRVTARTLERWADGIMVNIPDHAAARKMAEAVHIPVYNGGSDRHDPSLGMTGIFTLQEMNRYPGDMKIALLDATTPMINSWTGASLHSGCRLAIHARKGADTSISPPGLDPENHPEFLAEPGDAARDAFAVFSSPSDDLHPRPDSIEKTLLECAEAGAVTIPGLPVGWKKSAGDQRIEAAESAGFEFMENKLHIQKAIMVLLYERQL